MTKEQLFKRTLPIAISLIAILLLAFSCSALKTNSIEPKLTDPDSEYAKLGSITVTNEEVYNKLIDSYGASELSNLVDTALLTNGSIDYIALAKADTDYNVQEDVERSMFGGYTLEEIETSLSAEEIQKYRDNFNDSLVLNGYASIDDFKELLYLNHARILYTQDDIMKEYKESSSEDPKIALGDLKTHYEKRYYEEACAIKVKFSTSNEAMDALHRAGLDVNTDDEVVKVYYKDGVYIAPDDIANYTLDPDELEELKVTDEEILEAYVNIYNERYAYRTPITYSNGSILECGNEDVTFDYKELYNKSSQLADYIFRVLDTERNIEFNEDAKPYSTEPVLLPYAQGDNETTHNAYFIMYKVSGDNQNIFRDLLNDMTDEKYAEILDKKPSDVDGGENQALLDELLEAVIENFASQSSTYNEELSELRLDQKLTIYDSYLETSFNNKFGATISNSGDKTLVFSYINNAGTTVNVTTDEFFNILTKNAASSVMTIMNAELPLVDEDFVNEIITEDKENQLKDNVTQYKLNFQQGGFVQYGFDPTTISWEKFMYSAFQVRSERELYNALLKNEVTSAFNQETYNNEELLDVYYDLMDEYYQDAFEIDIMHFLVYVDNDENASPDLILEGNNSWTDNQHLLANELIDQLRLRLEEVMDTVEVTKEALDEVVQEYNDASTDTNPDSENYSVWAKFKRAGLLIKVEDLGSVNSVGYEEEFENEARNMYEEMIEKDMSVHVSENNISTRYGYHLMYSDKYKIKGDAYPDDDTLLYPTSKDIESYNNNDIDQSISAMLFIERYYKPMKEKYLSTNDLVIYDKERAKLGVMEFKNSEVQATYNKILEVNQALVERNE